MINSNIPRKSCLSSNRGAFLFSESGIKKAMIFAIAALLSQPVIAADMARIRYLGILNPMKVGKGEPYGCISGSLGRQKRTRGVFSITMLIQSAEKPKQFVEVDTMNVIAAWEDIESGTYDYFLVCLKPGIYNLAGFNLRFGNRTYRPPTKWAVPINISESTTTYIGNFFAYDAHEENGCRNSPYRDVAVIYRNRSKEDRDEIMRMPRTHGHAFTDANLSFAGLQPQIYACEVSTPD